MERGTWAVAADQGQGSQELNVLVSGISGGALMVLGAPIVLPHVSHRRRGVASGTIFAGVGPLLLRQGLTEVWCGLGVLSLFLTLVAWSGWPAEGSALQSAPTTLHFDGERSPFLLLPLIPPR
jgi:hypothetical protein